MKILFFFTLILVVLSASAQNNGNDKQFAIGTNFSPDYSYRTLKNNDSNIPLSDIHNNEIAKVGFTSGLNASYFLKENFSLEAGIHYSNKGYQTDWTEVNYNTIDPLTGFAAPGPNDPVMTQSVYSFNYIDIPITVNYFIGKRSLRLVTSAGIAPNVFVAEKKFTKLQFLDGSIEKGSKSESSRELTTLNLSVVIGIGGDIKLGEKLNLKIAPTYRYGLFNNLQDSSVSLKLWNAGLNIALNYLVF